MSRRSSGGRVFCDRSGTSCETPDAGGLRALQFTWHRSTVNKFDYPELELSKRLLAYMDRFYAPDMVNWKPPEDSPAYASTTAGRSFKWALSVESSVEGGGWPVVVCLR